MDILQLREVEIVTWFAVDCSHYHPGKFDRARHAELPIESRPYHAKHVFDASHVIIIKVKLRSDRETRKAWTLSIAEQCSAELIQTIGQVACFYRKNPDKPVINTG